jgi:Beta-propeller repeat
MLSSLLVAIAIGSAAKQPSPQLAATRRFEANLGQWPAQVRFVARTPHGLLTLGDANASLTLRGTTPVTVRLGWQKRTREVTGLEPLPGISHYLVGDASRWRRGVRGFGRVRYHDVAPAIDLDFYGAADGFEYDLIVRPGGDPRTLTLRLDGVTRARVDEDGSIVLETSAGTFRQHRPIAFQERGGVRTPVDVRYTLRDGRIGFIAARYDRSRPLVIDPAFDFSTYLGGGGADAASAVATDSAGNIYVTGSTASTDFPTAASIYPANAGSTDAFVVKLAPDGASLIYATYLGGTASDVANGIAVSAAGSAYVAGVTSSSDFPAVNQTQAWNGGKDAFVTRLSADGGSVVFSTYLGGSADDEAHGIAIDGAGAAYVTGPTRSSTFPLLNAFRTSPGGSFISKFTAAGAPVYSTYFGDTGQAGTFGGEFRVNLHAIAVDQSGAAYVGGDALSTTLPTTPGAYQTMAGNGGCLDPTLGHNPYPCLDGAVAKLSPGGSLVYATYLHATTETGSRPIESVSGITVDGQGNAYVFGTTGSINFPTTPGAAARTCTNPCPFAVFVSKLNPTGSALVFSSVLGSATADSLAGDPIFVFTVQRGAPAQAIALDSAGQVLVAGMTKAMDFPTMNPQQAYGGAKDGFVAALSPTGAFVYSSYLGGSSDDVAYGLAATRDSGIVIVGGTASANFPTANALQPTNAGSGDGFVTKLRFPQVLMGIGTPVDHATAFMPFNIGGWAVDRGSATDPGIDGVHVWAFSSTGVATFIGAVTPSVSRPDVAAWLGPQFLTSGFNLTVGGLTPGPYIFAIYPHSSVTNTFAPPQVLTLQVEQGGLIILNPPAPDSTTYGGAKVGGWAIDRAATTGTGVSTVHMYAYPNPGSGQPPIFLGVADYGISRPDVGAIFGSQFTNSGFQLFLPPLAEGPYLLVAFPFSTVTNAFLAPATVTVTIGPSRPTGALNPPANGATVTGEFLVGGWAIDQSAPEGPGVDAVHVWAFPVAGGAATFLGAAQYGISRPDVGAIFGSQFTPSGYSLTAPALPPGAYDIYAFSRSTVAGTFNFASVARITVQ